jgi:hypothetical protein
MLLVISDKFKCRHNVMILATPSMLNVISLTELSEFDIKYVSHFSLQI